MTINLASTDTQSIHYDFTGRNKKYRCDDPRRWTRRIGNDGTVSTKAHPIPHKDCGTTITYLARCGKCQPCREQRKAIRIARAMNEVDHSPRTWFDTRTFSIPNWLQFQADRGNGAAIGFKTDGIPDPHIWEKWQRTQAQTIKADFLKRLRKMGVSVRQSTHWEAHKDGRPHAHLLIHEQGTPVLWHQLIAASFIMPRGYARPERLENEGNHSYWKRVTAQLWDGWREWMSLRDDPSEDARNRRKQLPFQCGMAARDTTKLCRDNTRTRKRATKRAVFYAAKAAAYSSKAGGRWSASPGYGKAFPGFSFKTRENRNLAMAAMAAWWLTVATAAHAVGPASHDAHKGAAACHSGQAGLHHIPEWCRLAASNQELGLSGPRSSPLAPPPTGPPTGPTTTQPEHRTLWAQYLAQYYTDGGSSFPPINLPRPQQNDTD